MKIKLRHLLLVGLLAGAAFLGQTVLADQPHMESAIGHLRAARHQLEIARHDKGGHRDRAIQIIDNAISEVQAGMASAD